MTRPCVAKSFFCNKHAELPYECSKFRRKSSSSMKSETYHKIISLTSNVTVAPMEAVVWNNTSGETLL